MNLFFDFIVDKENKTIQVVREFAADRDLVWEAFTNPEIIVQWTAPKPYRAFIKEMDFRVGGRCLNAMISPENVTNWALAEYIRIDPKDSFETRNSFCDENANPKGNGYSMTTTSFEPGDGITTVRVHKIFDSLATVEMMATNGYKEGTAAGWANLDELLRSMAVAK